MIPRVWVVVSFEMLLEGQVFQCDDGEVVGEVGGRGLVDS